MKVCFIARPNYHILSTEIFLSIKNNLDQNFSALFITNDYDETKFVFNKIPGAEIRQVSIFIEKYWNTFDRSKLEFYEKKYNCEPIWKIIYADRFLVNFSYDYCIKTTVGLFSFLDGYRTCD
jgi:hypothetical protein